jgi:hypothetical protein
MPSTKKKSPMQLFKEAVALREEKALRYEKMKKKDGTNGLKLVTELSELDILIPKLESFKDEDLPLSIGNKSFLAGVYCKEKYNKWSPSKDIGSRQTEKGKEAEPVALALVSVLDNILLDKNEERVEDDWFSGHPDAFEGENMKNAEIIHDVKCPWDIETFFSYLGKPLPEIYYWQMQGYMALTGAKVSYVHFCLVNTPERFIKDAADRLLRNMNVISELSPEYVKMQEELINNMTFTDIPHNERRIKFIVERNDEDIEIARKRVEKCRLYLAEYENLHLNYDATSSTVRSVTGQEDEMYLEKEFL